MNNLSQIGQNKRTICCILILIFSIITVYFNSLKGSFQYDDQDFLQRIWVSNLEEYNKRVKLFSFNGLSVSSRPVVLLSYAFNNTISKNKPFGFHLQNLIFHSFTTIILFFVVRLAFQISRLFNKEGISFALIASLVFAVHPALTESVTYISSRSSEMMTFFYLLGVLFFLKIFQPSKLKFGEFALFIPLIAICFYFSISSKIVGATFPATLILLFLFLICPNRYPTLYKRLMSPIFLFGFVVTLLLCLALAIKNFLLDRDFELNATIGYYFLTQIKVIVFYYLKILLWPINLNADIGYPFTPPLEDFTLVMAVLIGMGLITAATLKSGQWAKLCAGLFIFSLAPTSSIIPLNDLAVERRVYLPSALAICPLFAIAIQSIPKNIRYVFLFFLLASFSTLTAERNSIWNDEFKLWNDVLKKTPNSTRPYANLGKAFYERGQYEKAEEYLKISIQKNYYLAATHYNLANIYMDKKLYDLAEYEYSRALGIDIKYYPAFLGLGSARSKLGKLKEAEKDYINAINIRSTKIAEGEDYPIARINLGELYGKMGRFEESIEQSKIALKLIPNSFKAHYNIGTASLKLGRFEKAKESFLNSLKIRPKHKRALLNIAFAYQKMGQFENSNKYFSKFLEVDKSFPQAYISMGINYAQMNKLKQAANSLKIALELDPKILNARTLLAKIYSQDGKNEEAIKQLEIALAQNLNLNAIRIQLGLMYWKSGYQLDRAKNLFETALKLSVIPNEKIQISSWLKELNNK